MFVPDAAWLSSEGDRLLDFARASRVAGGFAWLDDDGRPDLAQGLQLWITARMTHVFSLGHLLERPGCDALVEHGVAALQGTFEDRDHGGWLAEVRDGAPAVTDKRAYEHAFVVLASSSATAAGRPGAAALLERALGVVQERFWREDEGASLESWDRAWRQAEAYRGANANMHMTEAFLAAGDVTGDPRWHERALRIASRVIGAFARDAGWRVPEHFDAAWRPLPDYNADAPRDPFRPFGITPGHGLEWARLLLHLRATLDDGPDWLLEAARGLFATATAEGWDARRGGFVYTTDAEGRAVVPERFHWVVAEAISAAAALHAATGEQRYADWYERSWRFAREHLVDEERGSWRHELDEHNRPSARTWRGKPDVYHALQATLIPRMPLGPSLATALRDGAQPAAPPGPPAG